MSTATHNLRKRLRYQCQYRGIKELDILLGRFAAARLDVLPDIDLPQLEALLDVNENTLFRWLTGMETPPAAMQTPVYLAVYQFLHEDA